MATLPTTGMASVDAALDQSLRRRKGQRGYGWVIAVVVVGLALLLALALRTQVISQRPHDDKTVRVVLPPPPPPPPPPEVQTQETPPEPRPAPMDQPVEDTPPPPDNAPAEPTMGDSALTAREGAGPSNYGLAPGSGTGTVIGGRPGGGNNGFAAYAEMTNLAVRRAAQSDPLLSRGRYTARLTIELSVDGRVASIRLENSTGDARRDEAIRRLAGLQLPQRPPAGLRTVRIELTANRPGA